LLKIAWNTHYCLNLPDGHRFPMEKYNLLPQQLLYEGTINHNNLFSPTKLEDSIILNTHNSGYLKKLNTMALSPAEIRKTGFPLTLELIEREKIIMQGTIQSAKYAIEHGVSGNIAGGTHHAFADRGEGYCLLNDIAIAANFLLNNQLSKKILVVDLDVHQGNGTASIFAGNNNVFTFSMHGENNYPLKKEKSDLDVPLADGINDKKYLQLLKENLPRLIQQVSPDFVFYQCGVDILSSDKLGRLGVSLEGCKLRDRFVFDECKKNKIPISFCMGGGYSEKISIILEAHANTYREAQQIFF
jgi:acetoin utilization deacetylase AcuC-like enzyme